ncbi:hypothetical protein KPH14_009255 [Odynerus spinipes]|uniref:Uncharacterized protein n=1 Tax=Odynerus spinipes TaxID=1348599 RepID=A0AAD9RQ28_9HYME|nr:hypothetical protein KPH14_009255 [Odynerus spinipes]
METRREVIGITTVPKVKFIELREIAKGDEQKKMIPGKGKREIAISFRYVGLYLSIESIPLNGVTSKRVQ